MTDLDLPHAPAQSEELLGSLSPAEFDLSISEVLERLEPLESQIVLLAMEGRTREEIATELGYSKRSIQRKLEIIRSVLSAFFQ